MQDQSLHTLRYPIGNFVPQETYSLAETKQYIDEIAALPAKLTELVRHWHNDRLDTPYRPDGWTVRQLVHHVADSHINAYVRTKLALTEDNPTISPYEEGEWAKLPDSTLDIAVSLVLLRSLHERWVTILDSLTDEALSRTYFHPASKKIFPLRQVIALYAWHSEHHYQHAKRLAERNGWT